MLRTFNCGIGMIAVADEKNAGHVIDAFQEAGDHAARIGKLVDGDGSLMAPPRQATTAPRPRSSIAGRSSFETRRGSDFRARQQPAKPDRCAGPKLQDHLVISNVEGAGGLEKARARQIPVAEIPHQGKTREAFDAEMDAALRAAGAEMVCLAGFMRILSDGFVRGWEGRLINIHPSLLPAYKGTRVHERVIEAREALSGASVHFVVPELDAGPVIAQVTRARASRGHAADAGGARAGRGARALSGSIEDAGLRQSETGKWIGGF